MKTRRSSSRLLRTLHERRREHQSMKCFWLHSESLIKYVLSYLAFKVKLNCLCCCCTSCRVFSWGLLACWSEQENLRFTTRWFVLIVAHDEAGLWLENGFLDFGVSKSPGEASACSACSPGFLVCSATADLSDLFLLSDHFISPSVCIYRLNCESESFNYGPQQVFFGFVFFPSSWL